MKQIPYYTKGLGLVRRSPSLVFWVYLACVVIALPLTAAMRGILNDSFGSSLVQEQMRRGFDISWYGEFSSGATGLAATFSPGVVGILPVLGNLEKLLDGNLFAIDRTVLSAGILFLLAWAFLSGGILSRFCDPRSNHTRRAFFAASAEYFFRYVRLLVISLLVYWGLFRWISTPLHDWVQRATRDVTVERTAMLYTAGAYALVGLLLVVSSLILDYAKIAMVAEERCSAILAFLRGLRFFVSRPGQTLSLYLLILLAGAILVAAYALVAPGPGQAGDSALIATFLVGQCYLVGRIMIKLWFLASQTLLFQAATGPSSDVQSAASAGGESTNVSYPPEAGSAPA
jgi:hypothetical protein